MKHVKSQDCEELKVWRPIIWILAYFLIDAPKVVGELFLTNGLSVDPNPLIRRHQMWRGEEARLETLT